ncbi:MAG: DUF2950 domain-containing protein [Hyphomicrobiales bacterium]|nr:DUF2950 domain-containing protein [Hyphomicrobiales bacterium]
MTKLVHGIRYGRFIRSTCAAALALALASALPIASSADDTQAAPEIEGFAAASEPPVFATPEAAVDAFKKALEKPGSDAVAALLGLDPAKLKADENTEATLEQIKDGASKQLLLEGDGDRRILEIGEKLWPLPFPVVKFEDGWAFDTYAGLEEIVNRRVGENELHTIETMRAYVDAQEEYASEDRDEDGVEEFAQKLVSTEGLTDGLYWPTDEANGESPAGDLDQAELDSSAKGDGYFGYKYKILTAQGDNIAGGAYDYVINGNMIAGFALVAWPAKYGETGVKTFAVNQHGIVYETDLGPATDAIAKYIDRFNPDDTWDIVDD